MILATVKGQSLRINHPKVVADTIAYLEMSVQFKTEDWNGLRKYVHFTLGDEHYSFELVDDKITQDMHLDLPEGEWEVYIHGARYEDAETKQRITTEPIILYVNRTGSLDGEPFPELTGSVGEKVMATAEEALSLAKELQKSLGYDGAPKVRVNPESNEWEISHDEGKTWYSLGIVTHGDCEPLADGKATPGKSDKYAREDHVHPSDSTKQDTLVFDSEYNAETNRVATEQGVERKISALGVDTLKANAETAVETATEAKEIAEAISGIATESLKVANRAYEEKQDILAFDGEYNADRNKVATVETVTRKVAEIVANAPEDFDTLKELADWLTTHGGEAAQMNSAIKKNADDIVAERKRATEAESSLQESIEEASRQIEENILPQIVNADYNENNPESKAYIENRPFFEEDAPERDVDIRFENGENVGMPHPDGYIYCVSEETFTYEELLDDDVPFIFDISSGDKILNTVKVFEADNTHEDAYHNIVVQHYAYGENGVGTLLNFYIINDYENYGDFAYYGAPTKNGTYFTTDTAAQIQINRLYREGKVIKKLDNKFIEGYKELKAQADETEIIAKGANPAESYDSYQLMINALNHAPKDEFYKGQNINVVTMGVPDLWVKDIVADKVYYDYNSYNDYNQKGDQKIVQELTDNGYIQVGYYQLARLETQKVYLQDYVKYSDEPGNGIAGGKPGPIALNYATSCGLRIEGTAGKRYLTVYPGTDNDWVRRNGRCALVISQLDEYMKMGITGRKIVNGVESLGNQIDLGEEGRASALAWLGAVGVNDYAGEGKAGLIKTHPMNGCFTTDGNLRFWGATEGEVKVRNTNSTIGGRLVKLEYFDLALKYGLISNKYPLYADEQSSAQKWLGLPYMGTEVEAEYSCESYEYTFPEPYSKIEGWISKLELSRVTTEVLSLDDLGGCVVDTEVYPFNTPNDKRNITKSLDTLDIRVLEGGYLLDLKVLVVNTSWKFNKAYGTSLPSNGTYLCYSERDAAAADGNMYTECGRVTALRKYPLTKYDNKYLDLDNNAVIKSLMARIEALENKL